jgi:hypothetical protein
MSNNGRPTKPDISSIGKHEVIIELIWRGFKLRPEKADHVHSAVLCATKRDTGKAIKLVVKATIQDCKWEKLLRGKVLVWPMNPHNMTNMTFNGPDVFYCFVYIDSNHQALFFIMPSKDVFENLNAQRNKWLNETGRTPTDDDKFPTRFCIGVDATAKYSLPIPMEADFKDRWDLLTS